MSAPLDPHALAAGPPAGGADGAPVRGRTAVWWRRFRSDRGAMAGAGVFALLVILGAGGEALARVTRGWTATSTDFTGIAAAPGARHWFGSTGIGGDVFAQTCHGLARSLVIAIVASAAVTVIAALVGAGAASLGGRWERALLAVVHFLLVIPTSLLLALLTAGAGAGLRVLLAALIATGWMVPARVVWSMAAELRERDFVTAARYLGVRGWEVVWRHLIPNLAGYLLFCFATGVVATVTAETTLTFLGIGGLAGQTSLGALLADGAHTLASQPWMFFFPALLLTLLTVSVAVLADGLRRAMSGPGGGRRR